MVVWSLGFNAFGALLLGFVGGRAALLGLPPVFCFLDGPCIHARYCAQMQSADSKDLGGRRRPFDAFAHGRKSPACVTRVRELTSSSSGPPTTSRSTSAQGTIAYGWTHSTRETPTASASHLGLFTLVLRRRVQYQSIHEHFEYLLVVFLH
jgi:hypothetical protein